MMAFLTAKKSFTNKQVSESRCNRLKYPKKFTAIKITIISEHNDFITFLI